MAKDTAAGKFNGLITAGIMGPTITFTIPFAFSVINIKDRPFLACGVLSGLVSGSSGLLCGRSCYEAGFIRYIHKSPDFNTLPVAVISALVILALWIFPKQAIKGFSVTGTAVTGIITALVIAGVFQQVTGIMLPVLNVMALPDETTGLTGLESGILVCGEISIVLAGAFPMMKWITDTFGGRLEGLGRRFQLNRDECAGMIACLANIIPMITALDKMGPRGKLMNLAFCVGGFAVFGDFLGFTAGVDEEMILPMILGKLTAGAGAPCNCQSDDPPAA